MQLHTNMYHHVRVEYIPACGNISETSDPWPVMPSSITVECYLLPSHVRRLVKSDACVGLTCICLHHHARGKGEHVLPSQNQANLVT